MEKLSGYNFLRPLVLILASCANGGASNSSVLIDAFIAHTRRDCPLLLRYAIVPSCLKDGESSGIPLTSLPDPQLLGVETPAGTNEERLERLRKDLEAVSDVVWRYCDSLGAKYGLSVPMDCAADPRQEAEVR